MSKALLYAVNSNSQAVALNGAINFGNVVRRYGKNIGLSDGNVIISGEGYYDIDTNVSFTAGGTLTTITLYKNGVAIPGASVSLTTVADNLYSVSIPAIIRETGFCCNTSTITAVVTGSATTVTSASILVEKE